MRILNVAIEGFKSYDSLEPVEFHPHVNAIVGTNGSGKSNFFDAIRFVLSDETPEHREFLLFDRGGQGRMLTAAMVEITFDNSDQRIPGAKSNQVKLKRRIGGHKEEYFIDNKTVTKQEVIGLLESAGFSRSNPYYIVKQGKVNNLAVMKPEGRLELLKRVAGTLVYDEKKEESLKIVLKARQQKEQIDSLIQYIEERLDQLSSEREELQKYKKLDQKKRALEYTIYSQQLETAKRKLRQIDERQKQEAEETNRTHGEANETYLQVKESERTQRQLTADISVLTIEKEQLDEERKELIQQRAKLELEISDNKTRLQREKHRKTELEAALKTLKPQLTAHEKRLRKLRTSFQQAKQVEEELQAQISDRERRQGVLFSKLGRNARFTSKTQRDNALQQEIKSVNAAIAEKNKQIRDTEADIERLTAQIEEAKQAVDSLTKEYNEHKENRGRLTANSSSCAKERDRLANIRKELWRKDAEMEEAKSLQIEEKNTYERELNATIPRVLANGLRAMYQIADQLGLTHAIYGPLIRLFTCQPAFFTAAEVTGGNSLFHIIVDNVSTATKLIQAFNQHNCGRLTFVPLANITTPHTKHITTDGATPLIQHLKFEPLFTPVMTQVFGKTYLCSELKEACLLARTHRVDCVTLNGDKVSKKGTLTGGFHDIRSSRIEKMIRITDISNGLLSMAEEEQKLKAEIEQLEADITKVLSALTAEQSLLQHTEATMQQFKTDIRHRTDELRLLEDTLAQREQVQKENHAVLTQLTSAVESLDEELNAELHSQLSTDEQEELATLTSELTELREQAIAHSRTRADAEESLKQHEHMLNSNLFKQRDQLAEDIAENETEQLDSKVQGHQQQLKQIVEFIESTTSKLDATSSTLEAKTENLRENTEKIEQLKRSGHAHLASIQEESKKLEVLLSKRSTYLQQKDESERKLRDLGILPSDYTTYKTMRLPDLMHRLEQTNRKLRKFTNINKKAIDQFDTFNTQLQELLTRQEELHESSQAIEQLITALEAKKYEAISRTFKSVAKEFQSVFQALVPNGKGRLVLKRSKTDPNDFSSVHIEATFKEGEEPHRIEQLSGGEKSLVAIALIFAIQRTDPAPFYLFDEIDAALDPKYRAAVANLIASNTDTQFILSTFKPELAQIADKFFKVSMRNKRSRQEEISVQEALEIIATTPDAQDEPVEGEHERIDDSLPMELGGDDE